MLITTYVSYAEVRAAIGIATQELSDTQLGLDMYGEFLYQELSSISGTLAPDVIERDLAGQYTYLKALEAPTENQELLKSYIRLFALYVVAMNVADTLSLIAPKTISDGKSLATSFSSEKTFESVRELVIARKYDQKRKIKELLGLTITDKVYVSAVAPAIDVITDAAYEE